MDKKLGLLILALILVVAGFYVMNSQGDILKPKTDTTLDLAGKPSTTPIVSPTPQVSIEPASSPSAFPNGLIVQDLKIGEGAEVKSGDTISIHYLGTLENGTKFDSSYDRGQPFQTKIGTGEVIEGWDLGVIGMKAGGKRKLTIPPSLGYGAQQVGPIPPNSTLIFEVELVGIK